MNPVLHILDKKAESGRIKQRKIAGNENKVAKKWKKLKKCLVFCAILLYYGKGQRRQKKSVLQSLLFFYENANAMRFQTLCINHI